MRLWLTTGLLLCIALSKAQEAPNIKFGRITPADLQKKVYAVDSFANAVVISDVGSTEIVGNSKGWFSYVFKHYKRVHILNKNGYDEANVDVLLYGNNSMEEKLENLKAVTYNLEGGVVVETKLNKDAVFSEKESKKYVRKKFTLPGIKEGSIIEYEYRITSDFLFSLQPWSFQGASPCLWSEFRLSVPQFLNYVFLSNGNQPFYIRDKKDRMDNFDVREANTAQATESYRFSSGVTEYRWAMKDVPEIKEERFTSSVANHVSKIEFQLSGYREPLTFKNILGTWTDVTQELLKDEDFGSALDKTNGWIGDITKPLLAGTAPEEEKARKIFMYVRDNITCTAHNGIYASQSLKNILKNKNGTVSEINLLLTAMLRYAGIQAEPVLLSTKEHGLVYPTYPIVSRFNYVVTQATIGGLPYMLDASHARLGFGKLLPDCYNGHARIVNAAATPMDLFPDSLSERKITSVFMSHTDKEKWVGTIQQTPGYYESYRIRDKVKEKGEDDFFKEVKKGYGQDLDIEETGIDSLNKYELPVKVHYTVRLKGEDEDIMYMNPMFGEGYKENPFKSASRLYPVEMPYTFDETYLLTLQVPAGYAVDELPKPIRIKYNEENEGFFEYIISQSGDIISLRSRIRMQRATFLPEEYDFLRQFYGMVVNKQKEQIVLKKKK